MEMCSYGQSLSHYYYRLYDQAKKDLVCEKPYYGPIYLLGSIILGNFDFRYCNSNF